MGDSCSSITIDVEMISFGVKEHHIETSSGPISVAVYGDQDKPALVTYPDVALNPMSCFQGLFFCPEAASLLLHNFCIYNISPPGHELAADPISSDIPVPSVDVLADQVAEILDFLGFCNVYGSYSRRYDITAKLKQLRCKTLIFVGENSPFHSESLHMISKLDQIGGALAEVQACGSLVTEEQPHAMLIPLEFFFMGYGLYRSCQLRGSPRSPLSHYCISPELLSPESCRNSCA